MHSGSCELKPLTQREIALALDLHESTVSRASDHKFMLTPHGMFEFKYFFTGSVGDNPRGNLSAPAIQTQIRKVIESESPVKPISDSAITQLLFEQGINIARRTVAKISSENENTASESTKIGTVSRAPAYRFRLPGNTLT